MPYLLTKTFTAFLACKEVARETKTEESGTREVFYPNTEDLGPNEIRIVALGTDMPNARPKQAVVCWYT